MIRRDRHSAASSSSHRGPNRGKPTSYQAQTQAAKTPASNPYLPDDDDAGDASASKGRSMHRQLQFNRAGRHVRAAEEARREAQLEAIFRRSLLC